MYLVKSYNSDNYHFSTPRYLLKSELNESDELIIEVYKIEQMFWEGGENTDLDIIRRLHLPLETKNQVDTIIQNKINKEIINGIKK